MKFLRDLRLKFKREARGLKFKSKISKLSSHLLKFKSEILPRDFAERIIKFRRTGLCALKCRYALKFHHVLTSRHALKFCCALEFHHVLKHCRAAVKFCVAVRRNSARWILSFKFYKLSTRPYVHGLSV